MNEELSAGEIQTVLGYGPAVRKGFTKVFRGEGDLKKKYHHHLDISEDGRFCRPALALKSLNPDLVESYVTRHVDGTSFFQTNSTLTAPSQSRVPQADFVVRPPAEEVTAEKETGLSNKAVERLRRKTQQYEEQLSILRNLRENHELLILSLWNENKALGLFPALLLVLVLDLIHIVTIVNFTTYG